MSTRVAMIPARIAVELPPVIIINDKIAKMPIPMPKFLGKKENNFINHSATIVILYPESATMCIVPVFMKLSLKSLLNDAFSPKISPPISKFSGLLITKFIFSKQEIQKRKNWKYHHC